MKLEELQEFTLPFRFTQDDVNKFIEITGDDNPIHYDADYSSGTVFKRPIMHGFLSASVFSRIFGTLFPGEGTIYLSQSLRFVRPMYVEEAYLAHVRVVEIIREKHQCRLLTRVLNGQEEETIVGDAMLLNRHRI